MKRLVIAALVLLGSCAVTDYQYPSTWDPLAPPSAADCRQFAGSYADKGEGAVKDASPSLTYGLLGRESPWKDATRVDFAFNPPNALHVRVWAKEKPLAESTFSASTGDLACKNGKLAVRSKRWVATDLLAGRQDILIEFSESPRHLVAQIDETSYGVMFAVVPIAGSMKNWYRFARLGAK